MAEVIKYIGQHDDYAIMALTPEGVELMRRVFNVATAELKHLLGGEFDFSNREDYAFFDAAEEAKLAGGDDD